jgi:2,4-dienoyl-CoA reductase-like NADH-dependent reductase (Old Yellow Enzyme family)
MHQWNTSIYSHFLSANKRDDIYKGTNENITHVCINVYTCYNQRLYYDIYIGTYRFIFIDYSMFVYVNNVSVLYKYYGG